MCEFCRLKCKFYRLKCKFYRLKCKFYRLKCKIYILKCEKQKIKKCQSGPKYASVSSKKCIRYFITLRLVCVINILWGLNP
jgi:hypothetical protein